MARKAAHKGPVCYRDGWHWTVVPDDNGNDQPGERLVLDDDGSYRPASDTDTESWHDRKHQQFATIQMEDGTALQVSPDEYRQLQQHLAEIRGEN